MNEPGILDLEKGVVRGVVTGVSGPRFHVEEQ